MKKRQRSLTSLREQDARKNKDIVKKAYACTLAKSAYDRGWFHFLARNLLIFSLDSCHPGRVERRLLGRETVPARGKMATGKRNFTERKPRCSKRSFFLPNPYVIFEIVVIQLVIFLKSKDVRIIGNFSSRKGDLPSWRGPFGQQTSLSEKQLSVTVFYVPLFRGNSTHVR